MCVRNGNISGSVDSPRQKTNLLTEMFAGASAIGNGGSKDYESIAMEQNVRPEKSSPWQIREKLWGERHLKLVCVLK